jgi:hypothetical protein
MTWVVVYRPLSEGIFGVSGPFADEDAAPITAT